LHNNQITGGGTQGSRSFLTKEGRWEEGGTGKLWATEEVTDGIETKKVGGAGSGGPLLGTPEKRKKKKKQKKGGEKRKRNRK